MRWQALFVVGGTAAIACLSSSGNRGGSTRGVPVASPTRVVAPQLVVSVTDQINASLPGATVTVLYSFQGERRVYPCITGVRGEAAFWGIPAEGVDVSVTLMGFEDSKVSHTRLGSDVAHVAAQMAIEGCCVDRFGPGEPVNLAGTPLWSPTPTPTRTPIPPDMSSLKCAGS